MFTPPNMSHVTCHVSRVTCHMSSVTCHMSKKNYILIFFFFSRTQIGQSGGASRWRVCYQRGLPCLVLAYLLIFLFLFFIFFRYFVFLVKLQYIVEVLQRGGSVAVAVLVITCDMWHVSGAHDMWHLTGKQVTGDRWQGICDRWRVTGDRLTGDMWQENK